MNEQDPRARRAGAHSAINRAQGDPTLFPEALHAVRAAGDSTKSAGSGFDGALRGVAEDAISTPTDATTIDMVKSLQDSANDFMETMGGSDSDWGQAGAAAIGFFANRLERQIAVLGSPDSTAEELERVRHGTQVGIALASVDLCRGVDGYSREPLPEPLQKFSGLGPAGKMVVGSIGLIVEGALKDEAGIAAMRYLTHAHHQDAIS